MANILRIKITMIQKKELHNIDGLLILDKPKGVTSNFALQKIKHLFKAKKAGYVGTLDPFATGMLVICFGKATKLVDRLHEQPKSYEATLNLGITTETGDTEGKPTAHKPIPEFNETSLTKILQKFTGDILQTPPMYSAIKHQGQALYKLARQGKIIERPPRLVKIHSLKITKYTPSEIDFEVTCGKGVYIRTLGEDIAIALGTCGHLTKLRRTASAGFIEGDMLTLEKLTMINPNDLTTFLKTDLDIK
jgi:tRNA pseudouridine55 synthase